MNLIQIDVIGLKPFQACLTLLNDMPPRITPGVGIVVGYFTMHFRGQYNRRAFPVSFERFTGYRFAFPAPGRAEVAFDDGTPFYDLDLTAGTWNADHRCREDRYRGRFRVLAPDVWETVWRIAGPRKDQTLTTRYSRNSETLEM